MGGSRRTVSGLSLKPRGLHDLPRPFSRVLRPVPAHLKPSQRACHFWSLSNLWKLIGRNLTWCLGGHRSQRPGFRRRGGLGWWWRRDGCGRRLLWRRRFARSFSRFARVVGDGGLDDRLLRRIGFSLDGLSGLFWVVIQSVVDVLADRILVDRRLVDVGRIRQTLVGRPQEAAERIGELLSESGQAAADVRQSTE